MAGGLPSGEVMVVCMFMTLETWRCQGSPSGQTCRRRLLELLVVGKPMAFRKVTQHALLLVDDALKRIFCKLLVHASVIFSDCAKPYLISVFKDLKLDYALLMERCASEDLALQ
jgi:hypothetical protein